MTVYELSLPGERPTKFEQDEARDTPVNRIHTMEQV